MDITLDKKGTTEASIKIILKEDDYQPKVEEKVSEYRKKARLNGFRPGKAPVGLIKRMFGKAILVDEINHLISESLPKYIQEQNLNVLGEPLPHAQEAEKIDWDTQKVFEFTYDIGFVNDFEYNLSDVKLTHYEIQITDKEIDEEIKYYKERFGENEYPESVEEGDGIGGTLEQVTQPEEDTEDPTEGLKQEVYFKLEDADSDIIKQFTGLKKEESVTFDIRKLFPEDEKLAQVLYKDSEEVKEIKGDFTLTISNITRMKPAEINQDFYDRLYGKDEEGNSTVTSEEQFREKVKENLAKNLATETDYLLQRDIRDYYVEHTTFDMPDEFLKRWLLATNEKLTEEEVEKDYDAFAKEIKWDLIRNKVSQDHEIKVEPQEVREKAVTAIESQFGQPGILAQLGENGQSILKNFLEKNYVQMYNQAQDEKVLGLIKEKIQLDNKKVSLDEFKEIIETYNQQN